MKVFNDLAIGQTFRCTAPEQISRSVTVSNDSVYVKVGNAASVSIVNPPADGTFIDHIFNLKQPVQPLSYTTNVRYIPQWWLNNLGEHHDK